MILRTQHFDGLPVLSHNGIFTEIISNRNYGKTWCFKRRAFRRALKYGRKTLWLRNFDKEVKEATAQMFTSKNLQKFCGINPWTKDNPNGNFKQDGRTFYVKRKGKWEWFLKIYKVTDKDALRGSDDVMLDTIVYDEFLTTPEQERRIRGDRVSLFCDIFYSQKREHQVRVFLLGNRENPVNPFHTYFGIPELPPTWEGIRKYRNGTYVVQQVNNQQSVASEYDRKVKDLFTGTKYGDYLYNNAYKGSNGLKTRKIPAGATPYIQLNLDGAEAKIWLYNGSFYIGTSIDRTQPVYCLTEQHKYKQERILVKRQKRFFNAFITSMALHNVYYDSIQANAIIQPFYTWLSL